MAGGTSLAMYLEPADLHMLAARIDGDDELAWIVRDSPRRWIARGSLDRAAPRRVCIWHVPSGPLPLSVPVERRPGPPGFGRSEQRGWIDDPFGGWDDPWEGQLEEPRFGSIPGVYSLNLCVRDGPGGLPEQSEVGLSTLGWIGNRYSVIGGAAQPSTERNWAALRKWVVASATRVTRRGPIEVAKPGRLDVLAFPAAFAAIRAGTPRLVNSRLGS